MCHVIRWYGFRIHILAVGRRGNSSLTAGRDGNDASTIETLSMSSGCNFHDKLFKSLP
jgi:hypothetical protein